MTNLAYDPNGNIQSMNRYDGNALRTNNFAYTYKNSLSQPGWTNPDQNQLQSVSGYVNAYTYNAIGQMTAEAKVTGGDQYVEYDVTGKVVKVFDAPAKTSADLKVEYLYDDRGFRLAKINYETLKTTWYIRDASGNVLSVYEQDGTLQTNSWVTWQNLNGLILQGDVLSIANGMSSGTAESEQQLAPFQNGKLEYTAVDLQAGKYIGFGVANGGTTYRFHFYSGQNKIAIRKNGNLQTSFNYVIGDEVSIVRSGSDLLFYQNNTLQLTLQESASSVLSVVVELIDPESTVSNIRLTASNISPIMQTEIPVYGSGKLATVYAQQNGSAAYELTDHLGNVRALVKEQVTVYTATMEDNGQTDITNPRVQELAYFENLFETEVNDPNMNHTPDDATIIPNPSKAAYLYWISGTPGMDAIDKSVGPAIALKVNAGDTVKAEAYVRYRNETSFTRSGFTLGVLSSILGNSFAFTGGFDAANIPQTTQSFNNALTSGGFLGDGVDDTRPYAYLNYIVMDANYNRINSGWQRVTEAAEFFPGEEAPIPIGADMHEKVTLSTPVVIGPTGKYIYVWVSNESQGARVWFDDVTVTHTTTYVAQATDYGVWGDVLREQVANTLDRYRYGYQGQFAEKDDETGWHHFELREYDPLVGRWTSMDPYGQYWSPYIGMGNTPSNGIDPDGGECKTCPGGSEYDVYRNSNLIYNWDAAASGDGVFQLLPSATVSLANEFGGYNFSYYNSFGSQLNDLNFYAHMFNRAPSQEAQTALAQASIANRDPTILYGTLALAVAPLAIAELAPIVGAGYNAVALEVNEISLHAYLATNQAATYLYRHMASMGFRGLLRISAPGTAGIKAAVELNWQSKTANLETLPALERAFNATMNYFGLRPKGFYEPPRAKQ